MVNAKKKKLKLLQISQRLAYKKQIGLTWLAPIYF